MGYQKSGETLQKIYAGQFLKWDAYLSDISKKITQALQKKGLKFSIKSRIKTIENLNVKQTQLKSQKKGASKKIKDLFGLRVIVPFQEDVESVIDILQNIFTIVEMERKAEKLSYREFAYDSVHMHISIDERNLVFPKFCIKGCEIQIRTILQDAWAEVEHTLTYKSNLKFYSNSIRKKLSALNATLTLSDMIFQEIRDAQKDLEIWGQERFQELIKKATQINFTDVPKYLIEKHLTLGEKHILSPSKAINKKFDATLIQALEAHNIKDYELAIDLYTQILDLNPDLKVRSIIYNHRGMANFMLHLERQSLKDFGMSFSCDSTNYRALNNRALVLRRMGLIEESLDDFKCSLELKENQPEVFYLRAQVYYETKNYQSSLIDLKFATKLNSEYKEAIDLMKDVLKKIQNVQGSKKNHCLK